MSRRRPVVVLVGIVVVVVALGLLDSVARSTARRFDLTAGRHLTLTDETHEVLDAVKRPTRLVAVVRRDQSGRVEAASLLSRYRDRNRRLTFSIVDPSEQPGEVGRLGVDPVFGGVAAESDGRVERGPSITEQDVTAAVARLVRNRTPLVCFTGGHGEPSIEDSLDGGLSKISAQLVANGYRLQTLDLLANPAVPERCEALFVANPTTSPGAAATSALVDHLDSGGRALVLADPATPAVDLSALIAPYGLGFDRGLVLEGDTERRLPDDPTTPVLADLAGAHPVTRRTPPLALPGVMGVTVADTNDDDRSGLAAAWLVRTSPLAYLERTPADALAFDANIDEAGPIDVAAAADRSSNVDREVQRTCVVVVGDVDLATNAAVGTAGNGRLVLRALDWLTLDEDLVSVSANLPVVRPLAFTPGRVRYALFVSAGVVPALFLLVGAMVWALRRGR